MSSNTILSAIAYGYVYFFRGTPLLAQTFLIYYGLGTFRPQLEMVGLWAFFREAWYCAILAFTLNTSAYQAEILRGAIESVPKGQWEGAASLGLHKLQTLWKVVLPQALIVALTALRQRNHPDDQEFGGRGAHHRFRSHGRYPPRLFRAASTSRLTSGPR